tara:strand:- start:1649 stop:1999 length:351 start_codon:yes stop_codon:yes gene_type:complete
MKHNNDFKYDLKVGQVAEKILAELLENKTIEVKRDLQAIYTGNIYIEYESRNKPSGLANSQADFYCYFITDGRMFLIETKELKELCRKYLGTDRDRLGGDSNTSKGILLPLTDLIK